MDTNVQVALSGAIPALIAMWLVDRLDAKRPEPARTRRLVALAGMLSVIPAIIIGQGLSARVAVSLDPGFTYQGATFNAFVVTAAVEVFYQQPLHLEGYADLSRAMILVPVALTMARNALRLDDAQAASAAVQAAVNLPVATAPAGPEQRK